MQRIGLFNGCSLDESTGCWNWTGAHEPRGYGITTYNGKLEYVHRIAAILWMSYSPESKLHVLHRCDNPSCFNPKHIFLGTRSDNMRDCVVKGRHSMVRKTACPKGHPYATYRDKLGRRFCPTCKRTGRENARKARNEVRMSAEKTGSDGTPGSNVTIFPKGFTSST
jgi:hypothetical protein